MKSAIRHRQVLVQRFRQKADRLMTGALKLLLLVALIAPVLGLYKKSEKPTAT